MKKVLFSKRGFDEFKLFFDRIKKTLNETTKEKSDCGGGQDGWHDEGFKLGIGTEFMWSQQFGGLQDIMERREIVIPVEQNNKVLFGNMVILEDEDGNKRKVIIDGYLIEPGGIRASYQSPLGSKLLGKVEGDEIIITVGSEKKKYEIIGIQSPSEADKFLEENSDG